MDVGLHHHRPQGPVDAAAGLEEGGEEAALAELGDVELDVAGLGGEQPSSGAVAVRGALGGTLVAPGADALGGLEVDEGLEDELHGAADDVDVAAGGDRFQQFVEGRLVKGHRVASPLREPGKEHAEVHAMALFRGGPSKAASSEPRRAFRWVRPERRTRPSGPRRPLQIPTTPRDTNGVVREATFWSNSLSIDLRVPL